MDNYTLEEDEKSYHSNKTILSRSDLGNIGVCPAYFKYMLETETPKTPALILGSAFHKLVLEPDDFFNKYAVGSKVDRRTKEGREEYARFMAQNQNKEVISSEDFELISQMKNSIESSPVANAILMNTTKETSIYYKDLDADMEFKCRPDAYKKVEDKALIADLKSTGDASTHAIQNDIYNRNYDLQAYMYRKGVSKVLGIEEDNITFSFIFVEKTAPFLIHIVCCDDSVYQSGQAKFLEYSSKYKECLKDDLWPSYETEDISIPSYFLSKGE